MKMDHQCNQVLMFRKKLKSRLDPMRYEHSLSVSFTCMNLAMRYGYDIDKAELAGLLHDCGKRFPDSVILKKCLKHGIPVTEGERRLLQCSTQSTEPGWPGINIRLRILKF